MTTQPATLVDALVAAQAAMETPRFDAVNPAFRSRYASLAEVTRVAKAALGAQGIALIQPATMADGLVGVTTVLLRGTERLELGTVAMPMPAKAQDMGSLITYLRRYSLSSALAIVADDDDDANAANGNGGHGPTTAIARNGNGNGHQSQQERLQTAARAVEAQAAKAAPPAAPAASGATYVETLRLAAKASTAEGAVSADHKRRLAAAFGDLPRPAIASGLQAVFGHGAPLTAPEAEAVLAMAEQLGGDLFREEWDALGVEAAA